MAKNSVVSVYDMMVALGFSRSMMNYRILAGHILKPFKLTGRTRAWMTDDLRQWFADHNETENLAKFDAYLASRAAE